MASFRRGTKRNADNLFKILAAMNGVESARRTINELNLQLFPEFTLEENITKPEKRIEPTEWTVCGYCGNHLISKWKWCPYCGRGIDWKNRR